MPRASHECDAILPASSQTSFERKGRLLAMVAMMQVLMLMMMMLMLPGKDADDDGEDDDIHAARKRW